MDTNLLRSWVGLPPGPWPPADRDLLGLPADGPVDPATVETAALDRMARLRTHQLMHPDLVTEGMNRVAQAMMAVAAGHAPRRHRSVQSPPPSPSKPQPELEVIDLPAAPPPPSSRAKPELEFEPLDVPPIELLPIPLTRTLTAPAIDPGTSRTKTFEMPAAPVLEAVPVAADEPPVAAVAPVPAFRRPPPVEPIRIPSDVPPPPGLVLDEGEIPPHGRRTAYRELAGLRAVLRALDELRPSVALPGEGLLSPAAVCDLLEAIAAFRAAAAHPGLSEDFVSTVVPNLSAILFQPLPLAVFRSLTRSQRDVLAREWAGGRAGVIARMEAVRAGLERPSRGDPWADAIRWASKVFAAQPEVLLVAATVLVGLAAAARTAAR